MNKPNLARRPITYLTLGIIFIILLTLLAQRFLFSSNKNSSNQPPRTVTIPVQAAVAEQKNISRYLSGLGTVNAAKSVIVRSRVDGELIALHFTEGQLVNKGDLLAEIDSRAFQIQLQQAQGQLAKNQAALDTALRDLIRYQQLVKTNVVSRQELDGKESLVAQLQGSVQVDKAAVNQANLQLTYSQITAPISGRVGLKRVDEGNYISANDANGLALITQTQPIDVVFTLPERELSNILQANKENRDLAVEAWDSDNQNQLAIGSLLSIDNQIDALTGTIKLKARFTNLDEQLFPNQFVNIRIKIESLKNVIAIPSAAIQMNNNVRFVWVVDENSKVSRYTVTTGAQENNAIVVTSGLTVGQKVVTDGVDRLKQDAMVEIVNHDNAINSRDTTQGQP